MYLLLYCQTVGQYYYGLQTKKSCDVDDTFDMAKDYIMAASAPAYKNYVDIM